MTNTTLPEPDVQPIELALPIEGMTCAACSNRVERFLRKTDGVLDATVNLATEQARIRFDPRSVGRDELTHAVEAAGYGVRQVAEPDETAALGEAALADADRRARETRRLGLEAAAAIVTGVLMMAATLWLTPLIGITQLNPILLVPASIVQFVLGRRFYSAAWSAARHGSANMSTLVVLGTSAAWIYSTVVTFAP
ncbi:MAG TPA: cation transporter, partial [Candidatus Limnocylindrales bacterium]